MRYPTGMTDLENRRDFLFKKPNHSDQLLRSLNTMRKEGVYTDFALVVDDAEIQCHKVVLSSLIPYFNAMLSRYVKVAICFIDCSKTMYSIPKDETSKTVNWMFGDIYITSIIQNLNARNLEE